MRALPLTDKSRPGGRPRRSRAPRNPFADWLAKCGRNPKSVADELDVSISSIYNVRNAYFRPGRDFAAAIERITTDPATGVSACPVSVWATVKNRPRGA